MLNEIKGIKFKGAAFENETILQLFSQCETERVSTIFGRNGSGKSTISRAISKAAGDEEIEDIASARFVDSANLDIPITDDDKKCIFVFNEDYTNSKVRLKEDGLNTIVMFGEIVDIADKIEKATETLEKAGKDYNDQNEKYAPYVDRNNIQSPENQYEKVKAKLRGDQSWAGRERSILGSRINVRVSDAAITEIMKDTPVEISSVLSSEYDSQYRILQAAQNAGSKITAAVPTVDSYSFKIKIISSLLAEKIEASVLTNREKRLLTLVQNGRQSMLTDMKIEFSTETDTCPFCLQSITDEYKIELIQSIEKVLSKVAEEHRVALEKSFLQIISMDLSTFEPVDKSTTDNCIGAVEDVNDKIKECNRFIALKTANLYSPITDFTSGLQASVEILRNQLSDLDKKRIEYNKRIDDICGIQASLQTLNRKLAYYEIKDIYADYRKQKDVMNREKSKLDKSSEVLEKAKKELDSLNQKRTNVKIAVDLINKGLRYVFFSNDKLKVNIDGNNYVILSNNKPVKPRNISVGERNILALCYFFVELLKDIDTQNSHRNKYFIILDDPVSSFDLENRIGIISYLKWQIGKILRGNQDSKIVFLSHDLLAVYDIDNAMKEIVKRIKFRVNNSDSTMKSNFYELHKREMVKFDSKNRNEYSLLLRIVYNYASNKGDEHELVIGNIMRRMLEAFGTFEYCKGLREIFNDQTILEMIDEEKRDYFENLMYRLILNEESHLEQRTRSLADNNFFATITADEKRRTAKDVLCLMYLLNSNHIKAQLHAMKDSIESDGIENIEKWLGAITTSQNGEVSV